MTQPAQLCKIPSAEDFARVLHQAAGELLAAGFAGENWNKKLYRRVGDVAKNQGYCPDSAREWYQKFFAQQKNEEPKMRNFDPTKIAYRDEKDRGKHERANIEFCDEQNAGARFCFVSKDSFQEARVLNDVYYDFVVNERGSRVPFPIFVEAAGLLDELPEGGFSSSPVQELVDLLRTHFPNTFVAVVVAEDKSNYIEATREAIERAAALARGCIAGEENVAKSQPTKFKLKVAGDENFAAMFPDFREHQVGGTSKNLFKIFEEAFINWNFEEFWRVMDVNSTPTMKPVGVEHGTATIFTYRDGRSLYECHFYDRQMIEKNGWEDEFYLNICGTTREDVERLVLSNNLTILEAKEVVEEKIEISQPEFHHSDREKGRVYNHYWYFRNLVIGAYPELFTDAMSELYFLVAWWPYGQIDQYGKNSWKNKITEEIAKKMQKVRAEKSYPANWLPEDWILEIPEIRERVEAA